jgi:catechol 2,3-dioxygenase-like lactoylglutathione lyase family enzyme
MPINFYLHPSICVSDAERSVAFYREVLGFALVGQQSWEGPGPGTVMGVPDSKFTTWLLTRDGQRLELIHWHEPKSPPLPATPQTNDLGLSHLTVFVDDAEAFAAEMRSRGVNVREETWGSFLPGGERSFFLITDPDGFPIEVVERPSGMPSPYGA